MAKYQKTMQVGGAWAKGSEITAKKARIVSETNPIPSSFQNKDGSTKMQDVCRVQFQGANEPLNVSLNRATINALVEAYGEDSKEWIGHVLSVETETVRVAGKKVVALYLIPEGFKKTDDENGYAVIARVGVIEQLENEERGPRQPTEKAEDDEITVEDIPF